MSVPTKWFFVLAFIMALFVGTRLHAEEQRPIIAFTSDTEQYHVDFMAATVPICSLWNEKAGVVLILRIADRVRTWACFLPTETGFLIASPQTGQSFELPDAAVKPTEELRAWLTKNGREKQL
jgi:hypothetical protein